MEEKREWETPELRKHGFVGEVTQEDGPFDPNETECWES